MQNNIVGLYVPSDFLSFFVYNIYIISKSFYSFTHTDVIPSQRSPTSISQEFQNLPCHCMWCILDRDSSWTRFHIHAFLHLGGGIFRTWSMKVPQALMYLSLIACLPDYTGNSHAMSDSFESIGIFTFRLFEICIVVGSWLFKHVL